MVKVKNAEYLAAVYNDISISEENIKAITSLCQSLIDGDKDVLIGLTVLTDEEPQPAPAARTTYIPVLGISFTTPPPQQEQPLNDYEWVVNESTTLRILNVLKDSIQNDIVNLKKQL